LTVKFWYTKQPVFVLFFVKTTIFFTVNSLPELQASSFNKDTKALSIIRVRKWTSDYQNHSCIRVYKTAKFISSTCQQNWNCSHTHCSTKHCIILYIN